MASCKPGLRRPAAPPAAPPANACLDPTAGSSPLAHAAALLDAVEHQIIPRLMLLHRQQDLAGDPTLPASNTEALDTEEIESFTRKLLHSQDAALQHVQHLVAQGVSAPTLCLHLLAPSARLLGDMWLADRCDFTQVTIGLGRLQALLRGIAGRLPSQRSDSVVGRKALFLPVPGEQHTLGLSMVRDFFRSSGWDVGSDVPESPEALLKMLRGQRLDLLGFSIGSDRHIDTLAKLIAEARRAVGSKRLLVLVGGPMLLLRPGLVVHLGADAAAEDARQAILVAESLITVQESDR